MPSTLAISKRHSPNPAKFNSPSLFMGEGAGGWG